MVLSLITVERFALFVYSVHNRVEWVLIEISGELMLTLANPCVLTR
jgi:hypothetical protein